MRGGNSIKRMSSNTQKQVKVPKKKTSTAKMRPIAKRPAPRWQIVGDKVFMSGLYTIDDMKAALKVLDGAK